MTNKIPICFYTGFVTHKRFFPKKHDLKYNVFYIYADIDALPKIAQNTRLFSFNRFNLFSFYDRDHATRDGQPIRPWIEKYLEQKGLQHLVGHRIMVLCYPRILGYVFNPLTVYFIFGDNDQIGAILYEVKNTFGEQHGYLLNVKKDANPKKLEQYCAKNFHVSPFMDIEGDYHFTLNVPDQRLSLNIDHSVDGQKKLNAYLGGQRQEWSDKNILKNFFAYPLLTLKVIVSIHYEALFLWWKRIPFYKKPDPPKDNVT